MIIRRAEPADIPTLVGMVRDLAAFEREPDAVRLDDACLAEALFGATPSAEATVADQDGRVVGMAIYFRTFSTWTGTPGIHLEDLYVDPDHRGRGVARALLVDLARTARERGYERVEWSVLDGNHSAIRFYQSLGAVPMDEWIGYRLSGDALAELGSADHRA